MTRRLAIAIGVAVIALFAPSAASAKDLFVEANQDYAAQRYEAAIAKYEELVKSGLRHEALFYNLGNAYFRSAQQGTAGRIGRAVLNYERALELDPDDEDARYNLQVAREVVAAHYGKDTVVGAAKDPLWIRIATWMPMRVITWIFLLLDVAFFAILIAVRFLHTGFARTSLVVTSVFVGVAGAVAGALLVTQVVFRSTVDVGIVVADEVTMREGPDPSRRELPKLHAGHRVMVLDENHGWLKIRLANRMEGWVPEQTVDEI